MDDALILQLLSALGVPLFALGAFLFFWLMRRPWKRAQRFVSQGGTASAVVVGHVAGDAAESVQPMYSLVFEFRDRAGRPFRAVSMSAATHPAPVGTRVNIAYDVNDPNRAVLVGSARTLAIVGVGLALLFALFAAFSGAAFVFLSF